MNLREVKVRMLIKQSAEQVTGQITTAETSLTVFPVRLAWNLEYCKATVWCMLTNATQSNEVCMILQRPWCYSLKVGKELEVPFLNCLTVFMINYCTTVIFLSAPVIKAYDFIYLFIFFKWWVTPVTEEAQPCQCGETEGGNQRERSPLLRLWVHEGEPLPAHEGQVRMSRMFVLVAQAVKHGVRRRLHWTAHLRYETLHTKKFKSETCKGTLCVCVCALHLPSSIKGKKHTSGGMSYRRGSVVQYVYSPALCLSKRLCHN